MHHRLTFAPALAIALAGPLVLVALVSLAGCSGGTPDNPGPIPVGNCTGTTCGGASPQPGSTPILPLCPKAVDYSTTYTGGAGSGEYVKLQIDSTNLTYHLNIVDSPIPAALDTVIPTRAGFQIDGKVTHPTTLPSAEQNRCAFVLLPGNDPVHGYTTAFNPANPPIVFVGNGVAGGGIPGATIRFAGVGGLFPVPQRSFDFYPFIGFASVETDFSQVAAAGAGTYNALLYHLTPAQHLNSPSAYLTYGVAATEHFDSAGNCTVPSGATNTACVTTGGAWTPYKDNTGATSAFSSTLPPAPAPNSEPLVIGPDLAVSYMIVGKLNGALIPIVVRRGYANPDLLSLALAVDDESGIAMLAPAIAVQSGQLNGSYVGADANFKYTATQVQDTQATFIDPIPQTGEGGFTLDFTQPQPGLVNLTDTSANQIPGSLITSGGIYGVLLNGTENGGITASSSFNGATANVPYFGLGAQVNK